MSKKFIAILLVVTMAIGIVMTGCGSGAEKPAETTAAAAETTTAAAETTAAEPVELQYLLWMATSGKHPDAIIAEFNKKYPNITITPQVGSQDVAQYLSTQKIKLLSGDIDITEVRPETIADYAKAGLLVDLSDQAFLSNYNQGLLDSCKVDGKVVTTPEFNNAIGAYYNKDLFDKNGWQIPKDWPAMLALFDQIKASGMDPITVGGKDGWPVEFGLVYPIIQQIFVKDPQVWAKLRTGEVKYTDKVWVDAFTEIQAIYKKGYPPANDLGLSYGDTMNLFKQQKNAMWLTGDWMAGQLGETDFTLGVFPIPANQPGEELVVTCGLSSTVAIAKNSKKQEAAIKFLEFCSQKENASIIASTMGSFTAVIGSAADFNKVAIAFAPLHDMKTITFWHTQQDAPVNAEMLKFLQTMFVGKMTPEELCKGLQAAQDKFNKK